MPKRPKKLKIPAPYFTAFLSPDLGVRDKNLLVKFLASKGPFRPEIKDLRMLRAALQRLKQHVRHAERPLLQELTYKRGYLYITEITPPAHPSRRYTLIDVDTYLALRSKHAKALYFFTRLYRDIGKCHLTKSQLHHLFGNSPLRRLKYDALKPAVRVLNATMLLNLRYITIAPHRHLQLTFTTEKRSARPPRARSMARPVPKEGGKIYRYLVDKIGINPNLVALTMQRVGYQAVGRLQYYIMSACRPRVRNLTAYMTTSLSNLTSTSTYAYA